MIESFSYLCCYRASSALCAPMRALSNAQFVFSPPDDSAANIPGVLHRRHLPTVFNMYYEQNSWMAE